jgi:hypothetical protein
VVRGFSHGCHGEPQLGCGHFVPGATFSTACPHEDKPNLGARGQLAFAQLRPADGAVLRRSAPGVRDVGHRGRRDYSNSRLYRQPYPAGGWSREHHWVRITLWILTRYLELLTRKSND